MEACEAVLSSDYDPSILHYLIVERKCDPHIDRNTLLLTLLHLILVSGHCHRSIDVLCFLLSQSNIVPHITLDNGESVCLMCYPLTDDKYFINKPST